MNEVGSTANIKAFFLAVARRVLQWWEIKKALGVALPFRKFFTISLTKMSAKCFASQKPMFTGPFGGQKSPVYW
jgi:hypothetical protein